MHNPEIPHPIDIDLARSIARERARDAARRHLDTAAG